jgi:hypothetical protein
MQWLVCSWIWGQNQFSECFELVWCRFFGFVVDTARIKLYKQCFCIFSLSRLLYCLALVWLDLEFLGLNRHIILASVPESRIAHTLL